MIEVRQTEIFASWFTDLRDTRARARIQARIIDWKSEIPAT
jgi:putative component of toxin-antitoxin plasmid stabilization module